MCMCMYLLFPIIFNHESWSHTIITRHEPASYTIIMHHRDRACTITMPGFLCLCMIIIHACFTILTWSPKSFGMLLGWCRRHFWGSIQDHVGFIVWSFCNHFETILGSFCDHPGIFFGIIFPSLWDIWFKPLGCRIWVGWGHQGPQTTRTFTPLWGHQNLNLYVKTPPRYNFDLVGCFGVECLTKQNHFGYSPQVSFSSILNTTWPPAIYSSGPTSDQLGKLNKNLFSHEHQTPHAW